MYKTWFFHFGKKREIVLNWTSWNIKKTLIPKCSTGSMDSWHRAFAFHFLGLCVSFIRDDKEARHASYDDEFERRKDKLRITKQELYGVQ